MRTWLLAWACGLLAACGDADPAPERTCTATSDCPSGNHCGPKGFCTGDVACALDADCCLGERCEGLACRARQMCSGGSPCGAPGTTCLGGLCVPQTCAVEAGSGDAPCPVGQTCWWGRCGLALPCGGHCGEGEACAQLVDRCVALETIQTPCQPGELRMLQHDAARLAEGCGAIAETTLCRALPSLAEGQRGVPGVLVQAGATLAHVSYDRTYGDVVLARHAATPPFARQSLRVLAGLPAAATVVVGDPAGPRGGVAELGPDLGEALDAVADAAGRVQVALRGTSDDTLRYLTFQADGAVAGHVVASGNGVGSAVAIALQAGGKPAIAAFTPETASTSASIRLYQAQVAAPAAAAQWVQVDLDSEAVPTAPPPCGNSCVKTEVCVASGKTEACVAPVATGCSTCLPSQVCAHGPQGTGKPDGLACRERRLAPAPLDLGPRGRGAWLDLAVTATGDLVAAAYSPQAGDLALYRWHTGAKVVRTLVKASAVPAGSADFGRFPSITSDADGRILVGCEDTARGRLLLVRETAAAVVVEVLDDGARPDGHHRVGADVALWRHPGGGVLAVYQDTRRGDLLLATRSTAAGPVTRQVLAETGAAGFAPAVLALGSKALAVAATALGVKANGDVRQDVQVLGVVWSGN